MTAEQLNRLIDILAPLTLFEMMVAIGLGVTFADLANVGRNGRLVVRAAFANYVCYPAFAVGLLLAFHVDPWVAAGFLIAAVCPGAPYGPPFTGLARGNVVVAVGLMVLLAGSSALVAPALLSVLLPVTSGTETLHLDAGRLVSTLLVTQFLPLCIGLAVRRWWPALADKLSRPASRLSGLLNVALLVAILVAQFDTLAGIPARAFVGMSALVLAGVVTGWLFGGPARDIRTAMAMATAVRNVGLSLVIATASFPGSRAVTAATTFAIFQTIAVALIALGWGRLEPALNEGKASQTPSAERRTNSSASCGNGDSSL
ncbi:MAG: bile acid:sodium symporter [Gemmataceae bacterium]